MCIVDIDSGELDLPEELPEFPYEQELIDEIRNTIVRYRVTHDHELCIYILLTMSCSNERGGKGYAYEFEMCR